MENYNPRSQGCARAASAPNSGLLCAQQRIITPDRTAKGRGDNNNVALLSPPGSLPRVFAEYASFGDVTYLAISLWAAHHMRML